MNFDAYIRIAAVVAAAALVAAPYRNQIAAWVAAASKAASAHAGTAGRIAAGILLIAAAWGRIPLPELPIGPQPAVTIKVDTPSPAMQSTVQPIAEAIRDAPMSTRLLWASLWTKAAAVVAGDVAGAETVLADTRALRLFNILALDIGWRRIGEQQPGKFANLRGATEAVLVGAFGTEVRPIDAELRAKVVEVYKAIAWAGMPRG